jgi:predicted DNA-binding transcriptional regulator AlpA
MSAVPPFNNRFLTESEVSEYLGLSIHALRRWRTERRGPPCVKLSTLVRYPLDELEAWIASQPKGGEDREKAA